MTEITMFETKVWNFENCNLEFIWDLGFGAWDFIRWTKIIYVAKLS
jgi:hypothetical protein